MRLKAKYLLLVKALIRIGWFELHIKKRLIIASMLFLFVVTGCTQYHKLQKDVQVYPKAKLLKEYEDKSNKERKHELWSVDASIDDVTKFYQDKLAEKKWKKEMTLPTPDKNGYGLVFSKDDKMIIVMVFPRSSTKNDTLIDFSTTPLPK